jgi:AcrR family transcriptional regulator
MATARVVTRRGETRARILVTATELFGTRGLDAVSLDLIASEVGVAKQTVLYWFPSKDDLVQEVLSAVAAELVVVVEAAIRAASPEPLDRLDAVVKAVFRAGVRKPELLGLVREVSRLPAGAADRLTRHLRPMVARAEEWMRSEMDAGRLRRADPAMIVALVYATVTGIATEPEALRVVGWTPDVVGLRRLRTHLVEFVRAALRP